MAGASAAGAIDAERRQGCAFGQTRLKVAVMLATSRARIETTVGSTGFRLGAASAALRIACASPLAQAPSRYAG